MRKTKWLALVGVLACGDQATPTGDGGQKQDPSELDDGSIIVHTPGSDAALGDAKPYSNTCATVTTGVDLQPVHLAFAFDVSGSMGKGDQPWHDRTLKWDPVVSATKSFFASPASKGLSASLTFFPDASNTLKCMSSTYAQPDVAFTALPSAVFASAIDAITPKKSDDWRGGTPTLAVLQGTAQFVADARERNAGRYALVLVTDGYPQSCSDDSISSVVAEAEAQLAKDLPTYVIGVANPPVQGAPDTVSDLNEIAAAGGTTQAVLIDTGNPAATASAFSAAIEQIRKATISCNLAIPSESEAGRAFDKQSVVVHYDGTPGSTELVYDKPCSGSMGWHYDAAENPTEIVLCPSTCDTVRADGAAKLAVEFACEHVIVL